jgi:hypothetical protein
VEEAGEAGALVQLSGYEGLGEKSIRVEQDIPRQVWKLTEEIPQRLHRCMTYGESDRVLSLG